MLIELLNHEVCLNVCAFLLGTKISKNMYSVHVLPGTRQIDKLDVSGLLTTDYQVYSFLLGLQIVLIIFLYMMI